MAEVYLAIAEGHRGFNKLQVLKVLRSDFGGQERIDFLNMFKDEARLAARLNHPNIVQSHETGSEDGLEYIAMEYLDGQPLNRIEQRAWSTERNFPIEMRLFVLCQVLDGLEYAHRLADYDGTPLNIVHRDVSPQNVFVTYAGPTKLVDFGIAKTLESYKTRAGVVKGKVPYMAPEQALAGPIDHRTDLFSVGVMLWEAVARCRMHAGTPPHQIMQRLVRGELPKIRDAVPDVPEQLEGIISRAIAPKPEDRYPDASTFRDELAACLDMFPRVSARAVGEQVASLFAEERKHLSESIRAAMIEVSQREAQDERLGSMHLVPILNMPAASPRPSAPPGPPAMIPSSDMPAASPGMPPWAPRSYHTTPSPVNLAPIAPAHSASRFAIRRWGVTALVVAAAGAGLLALALHDSAKKPVPSGAPSAVAANLLAPAAPSVNVVLHALPAGATLFLDGKPLGNNPYVARLPSDDAEHRLDVQAPGFNERTTMIRLDRDLDLELRLSEAQASAGVGSQQRQNASAPARVSRPPQKKKTDSNNDYPDLPPLDPAHSPAPPLDTTSPWELNTGRRSN